MLHGQTRFSLASRFLNEIPENLLKWLNRGYAPSSAAKPLSSSRPDHGLRVGQNVEHAKFGKGVVVNYDGDGKNVNVQVNFGAQGVKWLILSALLPR